MPKRVPALTARHIAALKPQADKQVELVDGQVPGLRVRMNPSGKISWSLNVSGPDGVRRRYDVGAGFSLADARRRAEEIKRLIRSGVDPVAERQGRRARATAAKAGEGTLAALVAEYYSQGPGAVLASKLEQQQRIRSVFQKFLKVPAPDLSLTEMQRAADRHPSASAAARAIAYVRPLLKWASKRKLASAQLLELEMPTEYSDTDEVGQRVLDSDELVKILPVLRKDQHGRAALFMLFTAARRSEVATARWRNIDFNESTWTIPPQRRKDTRRRRRKKIVPMEPHVIPLARQAIELLLELGPRGPDDIVFPNANDGVLGNWDRWQKRVNKIAGVGGWDRHALRRTCATICGNTGAGPHIVDIVLGHRAIGSSLSSVYNKSRYLPEHRAVLQTVADQLQEMEGST